MTSTTITDDNNTQLETIDYKPPAPPVSCSTLGDGDEKKMDDYHHDDDDDHHNEENDAQFDLYSEENEWDEGGKSHCGYSEVVHSTLMSVGESVHKMMGEPSPRVEKELKAVGNWFQEASYAARDLFSSPKEGEDSSGNGMKEDAMEAVKTLLRGGSKMERSQDEENTDPAATATAAGTADAPLSCKPVEATN